MINSTDDEMHRTSIGYHDITARYIQVRQEYRITPAQAILNGIATL